MRCQKAMTVAKTAMRTTLIPVTVSSFEMLRRHIGQKVTTVTRMAAFRRHVENDDSYEDGDLEGPHRRSRAREGGGRGVGTRSADAYTGEYDKAS